MRELAVFQQEFGRALLGDDAVSGLGHALAIHRNTSLKGLADTLAANYPTLVQLVGEDWFRTCAVEHARKHPPRSPVLALYGASFPMFLAEFPPAREIPYLAEVARIDRLWVEAHTAADSPLLTAADLSAVPQKVLGTLRLSLHPAARIAWVRNSAATIWIHHRSTASSSEIEVDDSEEGILLTRPNGRVEHQRLDRSAFAFLHGVRKGLTLAAAAETTLTLDSGADVAALLARTLVAGAFERPAEMQS